jgi:hypothetical protein
MLTREPQVLMLSFDITKSNKGSGLFAITVIKRFLCRLNTRLSDLLFYSFLMPAQLEIYCTLQYRTLG